ncbi:MAG: host attachment protein [Burkholderiales bacterium]
MSTRHRPLTRPPMDWVLVANASRARCFERDADNHAMRELEAFVHPQSRQKGAQLEDARPGHAHKGVASTQFDPHTDVHEKEHAQFARELADHLDAAALAHRLPGLVLIASSEFLGELRSQLEHGAAGRLVKAGVALDLTAYNGAELERRVSKALDAPG